DVAEHVERRGEVDHRHRDGRAATLAHERAALEPPGGVHLADAQDELLDELARPAVAARGVEQALAQPGLACAAGEVVGPLHARSVEETHLDPPTLRVRGPCGGSGDAPEARSGARAR